MKDSFRDWLVGTIIFALIALTVYMVGTVINPYNHLSLLECWGIFMLIVILRSGYLEYTNGTDYDRENEN